MMNNWKTLMLKDTVDFLDHKRIPLKEKERHKKQGLYPYYGASGIIDYIDDFIFSEDLILLAEDGANILTRSTPIAFKAVGKYWVNNHAHVLKPKENYDIDYLIYYLESLSFEKFNTGAVQPKLKKESCQLIPVLIPPLPEQKAIADALQTWDTAIEKTEKLIIAKEKRFEWLVRTVYKKIANSKGEKTLLLNYMQPTSHIHGNKKAIIAAVGKKGIRNRADIYSKELSKDYSKNKLVYQNEIVFGLANKYIVYGVNVSSVTYSVSPAYNTFKVIHCNSVFLNYLLYVNNTRLSLKYLITSARQGKSIDFSGLLQEKFNFPDIAEQEHIAKTLNTARREIDLLKELAVKYRTQKRGLMQKLLTGKWRVKLWHSK